MNPDLERVRVSGRLLRVAALTGLLIWMVGCDPRNGAEPKLAGDSDACRPNVVIYMIDTLRRDHLGLYGYHRDTTPNLDRFSADAVVFETAYAPSAWTRPSTASLLTGLNPPRHGAEADRHRLGEPITLLSEYLRDLGYHTAAFVANPHVVENWGFGQGFEHFQDIGATTRTWARVGVDRVNREVFEHLKRRLDGPFFYYIHTIDPHHPYDPVPPYRSLFTNSPQPTLDPAVLTPSTPRPVLENLKALYDAEIYFNDLHFGELMSVLKEEGVYDESVIIVVSDHGDEHLDHGMGGHSRQVFNEVVSVPMLIKLPEGAHAGKRVTAPASLIDVVPTILSLTCQQLPKELEGIDLTPSISDEALEPAQRPIFIALNKPDTKGAWYSSRAVILGDYKYIEETSPRQRKMLFNLSADPLETEDLVKTERERASELATILDEYFAATQGGFHLKLVNAGDQKTRVVRGRITTTGRFTGVRRVELEEGDVATVDDSGKELSLRLVLRDFPTRLYGRYRNRLYEMIFGSDRRWVQDIDSLLVRVDPPDAPIRVMELASEDGEPMPLFLGPGRRPQASLPVEVSAADSALIGDPGALFREERRTAQTIPMGGYLLLGSQVESAVVDMPDDLEERLKALGYLGETNEPAHTRRERDSTPP
jgi:arylsulfatase A-like enzyme